MSTHSNEQHSFYADPWHFKPRTRREFLRVGVISSLGLSLGDFFALRSARAETPAGSAPAADAVIQIMCEGGMSHVDTFDPKPDAPIEIRGDLGVIKNVSGEYFGALLKRSSQVSQHLAVVRSCSHSEAAHERGQHSMLTGHAPSAAITYPSMGSVVAHEFETRRNMPSYICVPEAQNPWLGTGYLPTAFGPFGLGSDPQRKDFKVRDLSMPDGLSSERAQRQRSLLSTINAHFRELEQSPSLDAMDSFYQRAYSLLSSKQARAAFDIQQEPDQMRDAYGRHDIGQRLLLSRRLVEAGARFVSVSFAGWDHHKQINHSMRGMLPRLDQAFAQLIVDLNQRGLLERTLVLLTTEFGRTPRINADAGRDHWPKVFSVVLAGGGIQGGVTVGASDPTASEPIDQAVRPADISATLFKQLGIDPHKKLMTAGGRPIDLVRQGTPLDVCS